MSVRAMAWALDARRTGPIGAEARLVLVALADYTDPAGRGAYPGKPTLAETLGIEARTVQRHLATLRELGLIYPGDQELVSHYRADRRPNVYNLDVHTAPTQRARVRPVASMTRGDSSVTPQDGDGVTEQVATGGHIWSERGDSADSQSKNITNNENPAPQTPLVPDDGKTPCPVCGKRFLNVHRCQATGAPTTLTEDVKAQALAAIHEPAEPEIEEPPLPLDEPVCYGCGNPDAFVVADGLCRRCLFNQASIEAEP